MRKGAFTIGMMICNSTPVDIRGVQFEPEIIFTSRPNGCATPPAQLNERSSDGHPNWVVLSVFNCPALICNCDLRRIASTPKSAKRASVTGPAIGIRYSPLAMRLVSPPGKINLCTGKGTVTQLEV